MLRYQEQRPPDALAYWVECCWSVETSSGFSGHSILPDGCLDILWDRSAGLGVIGAMTYQQRVDLSPDNYFAGIRFRPGMAASFLEIAAAELTDGSVPLEDISKSRARALRRQLDGFSNADPMKSLLTGLRPPAAAINPVQRAIAALVGANGNLDVDELAGQANLSARHFRRRCLEESGLSPKLLARILRFSVRVSNGAARCMPKLVTHCGRGKLL